MSFLPSPRADPPPCAPADRRSRHGPPRVGRPATRPLPSWASASNSVTPPLPPCRHYPRAEVSAPDVPASLPPPSHPAESIQSERAAAALPLLPLWHPERCQKWKLQQRWQGRSLGQLEGVDGGGSDYRGSKGSREKRDPAAAVGRLGVATRGEVPAPAVSRLLLGLRTLLLPATVFPQQNQLRLLWPRQSTAYSSRAAAARAVVLWTHTHILPHDCCSLHCRCCPRLCLPSLLLAPSPHAPLPRCYEVVFGSVFGLTEVTEPMRKDSGCDTADAVALLIRRILPISGCGLKPHHRKRG